MSTILGGNQSAAMAHYFCMLCDARSGLRTVPGSYHGEDQSWWMCSDQDVCEARQEVVQSEHDNNRGRAQVPEPGV